MLLYCSFAAQDPDSHTAARGGDCDGRTEGLPPAGWARGGSGGQPRGALPHSSRGRRLSDYLQDHLQGHTLRPVWWVSTCVAFSCLIFIFSADLSLSLPLALSLSVSLPLALSLLSSLLSLFLSLPLSQNWLTLKSCPFCCTHWRYGVLGSIRTWNGFVSLSPFFFFLFLILLITPSVMVTGVRRLSLPLN